MMFRAKKKLPEKSGPARLPGSTTAGNIFPQEIINAVWEKAENDPGYTTFKKDCCGTVIQKNQYRTAADHGWEIDHIKPVVKGGTDDLDNLQPLHWENNRLKSNKWPNWECPKKS